MVWQRLSRRIISTSQHLRGCTCLKCTNNTSTPQGVHLSQVHQQHLNPSPPQHLTISPPLRGCTCLKCTNQANSGPPTDCTEFTEPAAGESLPQIAQINTDSLGAEDSSGGILPPQQQLCLGRINNGLNGLNGFDGCVMLTTD